MQIQATGKKPVGRPRKETHIGDIPIQQKPPIIDDGGANDRVSEVIVAESPIDMEYAAELAFNEEPVTIRIEPSGERNPPHSYHAAVNGKGAEVLIDGKWIVCQNGYLPVGIPVTTKRKYVAILIGAKFDSINTHVLEPDSERPRNMVTRNTSSLAVFSILRDDNPRGAEWVQELRRRAA